MERLTDNTSYCTSWSDCEIHEDRCPILSSCYDRKIYNKLKAYEDAEEQGLLIRLPCNVEDIVYRIDSYAKGIISPMRVWKVVFTKAYGEYSNIEIYAIDMKNSGRYAFFAREINKAVFLTREEAESALGRMKENA